MSSRKAARSGFSLGLTRGKEPATDRGMQTKSLSILAVLVAVALTVAAKDNVLHSFKKITLSRDFYAEGAYFGDFNHDGKLDVVAGPFWFQGPDFQKKYEYRPAKTFDPGGYSDNFLTFAYDFNGDGWTDILVLDTPSAPAYWYENPQGKEGHWAKHLAFSAVDNESPSFGDLNDDGKPELVFNTGGYLGYAMPDWDHPNEPWKFHPISPKGTWHKYTHGIGFGDVNGDGRTDFLEIGGWWERPASLAGDPVWKLHPAKFGDGAAQMFAYDFNGDGKADILTCLHPHQYGLAWFEQVSENGQIAFREHDFMGKKNEDNPYGVKMTQMHAFALVDMDGDGIKDFVTGKRWWAHKPPTDPESDAPAALYWFRTVRDGKGGVDFVPYLIDDDSGVGTQVVAQDLNGDGLPDVMVANKKGMFIFMHQTKTVSQDEWEKAQPKRLQPR